MRKIKHYFLHLLTYLLSSVGIIVLLTMVIFIFGKGYKLVNFNLITGNYHQDIYDLQGPINVNFEEFINPKIKDSYYNTTWGISFKDSLNNENEKIVIINYLDFSSNINNLTLSNDSTFQFTKNLQVNKIIGFDDSNNLVIILSNNGAEKMAQDLERVVQINSLMLSSSGGGIRGSIITTIYLILLTLIIALPIGISSAIYLNEFAKPNKITVFIRHLIDLLSGVPSVVFGLIGAYIFIPFTTSLTKATGGNIISGSLTLSIILLPIIIKTTEEALKAVPNSLRQASLALGASQIETVFKVVIPSALSGILTSTVLSIARINGESAALIFAIGTAIKDQVKITEKSTSLAVHLWTLMAGEVPNLEMACTIAIIMLLIVFILNLLIKLITQKFTNVKVI